MLRAGEGREELSGRDGQTLGGGMGLAIRSESQVRQRQRVHQRQELFLSPERALSKKLEVCFSSLHDVCVEMEKQIFDDIGPAGHE
jgi:hypothetical protein